MGVARLSDTTRLSLTRIWGGQSEQHSLVTTHSEMGVARVSGTPWLPLTLATPSLITVSNWASFLEALDESADNSTVQRLSV